MLNHPSDKIVGEVVEFPVKVLHDRRNLTANQIMQLIKELPRHEVWKLAQLLKDHWGMED